ncbi:16S rRNA (uracil(1498)-N(3))-methyltransferase [Anaeromyxobacter oryzae]|uniref:Ribosomal RNA small subunit methyltransferase E n=1 Tax=Anaeromyxobacter oryzae TaxID=2918170 RepID=A0ABN6MS61_9BACT|nr:16S rRNA (uracil(1498)-N(3))-methyltransferase [Anaeromyxobacter oryzae]BDG03812.1 ribosomal RNA small subunit methyltransferase E [Anaeromyxobacter oryzae]
MTVRRVHLPPARIAGDRAALTEEARHYLRDVLRLAAGAAIEVFDGAGGAYDATIGPGFEALALGPRREAPRAGAEIALLFALSKGEKMDLVVQKATELGVAVIAPFAAERSVVRLEAEKGAERAGRWRRIAEEAARQCGRADVPDVLAPAPLAAALAALPPGAATFVFHPGGAPLATATPTGAPVYAAVVGPEGGLTPGELEACERAGARRAGLGPRVLRAETAAIASVTLLQARFGDLG